MKKAKEYASKQELEKELGNRKEKLNFNNKELLDDLYETEKERIELEKESTEVKSETSANLSTMYDITRDPTKEPE